MQGQSGNAEDSNHLSIAAYGMSIKKNGSSTQKRVICDLCQNSIPKNDEISLECNHKYHSSCLREGIKLQIVEESFPVMCLVDNCEQEPSMLLLSLLLSRPDFQACLLFEHSLCPIINQNHCFNCGQRFLSDSEVDFHHCIKCKHTTCLLCQQQYHPSRPCKPPPSSSAQLLKNNLSKNPSTSSTNGTAFIQKVNINPPQITLKQENPSSNQQHLRNLNHSQDKSSQISTANNSHLDSKIHILLEKNKQEEGHDRSSREPTPDQNNSKNQQIFMTGKNDKFQQRYSRNHRPSAPNSQLFQKIFKNASYQSSLQNSISVKPQQQSRIENDSSSQQSLIIQQPSLIFQQNSLVINQPSSLVVQNIAPSIVTNNHNESSVIQSIQPSSLIPNTAILKANNYTNSTLIHHQSIQPMASYKLNSSIQQLKQHQQSYYSEKQLQQSIEQSINQIQQQQQQQQPEVSSLSKNNSYLSTPYKQVAIHQSSLANSPQQNVSNQNIQQSQQQQQLTHQQVSSSSQLIPKLSRRQAPTRSSRDKSPSSYCKVSSSRQLQSFLASYIPRSFSQKRNSVANSSSHMASQSIIAPSQRTNSKNKNNLYEPEINLSRRCSLGQQTRMISSKQQISQILSKDNNFHNQSKDTCFTVRPSMLSSKQIRKSSPLKVEPQSFRQ